MWIFLYNVLLEKYCKKYLSILIFLVFNLHPKMYICFKEATRVDAWKSNSGTISPILWHACGEKMTFLGLADALTLQVIKFLIIQTRISEFLK